MVGRTAKVEPIHTAPTASAEVSVRVSLVASSGVMTLFRATGVVGSAVLQQVRTLRPL